MAFKSLEKKHDKRLGVEIPVEPFFPTFGVDSKQLPEIEDWKVGETYEIKVKIRQVAYREFEGELPTATFEIVDYEA